MHTDLLRVMEQHGTQVSKEACYLSSSKAIELAKKTLPKRSVI